MATTDDIGRELERPSFRIDPSKVGELARSLFDEDPVYRDEEAARAAGFAGLPVPLTASTLTSFNAEGGALGAAAALGLDLGRLLHGEASWEYVRPLRVGDALTGTTTVLDVTKKEGSRGGTMTLVVLGTEFRDAGGDVVLRKTDTLIERGA
ncbi:hypothetical protein DSM112329_01134 [Paraconexibacter sp. AEG42_29]|uniref:FAS1-like dehydratase domain-containing protein n=1 Tax=Paraconexibacter sp. AEG42_29 TaxID=2997339 RepID=A0AAU7AS27_9ACTN